MMAVSSVALVVAVAGMLSTATEALQVTAPSEGLTVVAASPYAVEWTGSLPDTRFDVDLTYCGSYSFCFDDFGDCGFLLANLCMEDDTGCVLDADGGYDVVMPEPLGGNSGNGYRVRIAEVGSGRDNVRCSDDFYLMASADVPLASGAGGPSIAITSPDKDSVALPGGEYTVEFDYDNGFGSTVGRFKIDLYTEAGSGDCGGWVESVCDKPDVGCKDSSGNYNIVIPQMAESGSYKIRVGVFGDDSVYACSEAFGILAFGEELFV